MSKDEKSSLESWATVISLLGVAATLLLFTFRLGGEVERLRSRLGIVEFYVTELARREGIPVPTMKGDE